MRSIFSIKRDENFSLKILGHNIITYYNHYILRIDRNNVLNSCSIQLNYFKMTDSLIKLCSDSDFNEKYILRLKENYPNNFIGYILTDCNNNICGYICGLRPKSNEIQYKIRKTNFFVKYVFVYEKYRGKRISSALFYFLMNENNLDYINLAVRKDNIKALKAYSKLKALKESQKKFVRIFKFNIPYYSV